MKRAALFVTVLLLAPLAGVYAAEASAKHPTIILVLADDLGAKELSCYGNQQHQTPNLDRMAAEGMRFTDAIQMGAQSK